jgi:hypothetical protein
MLRSRVAHSSVAVLILAWSAAAYALSASTNVALIPDNHGAAGGAGFLPTSDPAFSGITFTNLALADVSAANLTGNDTVVLNQVCDPINQLSPSQRTDLVNFVNAGGKMIIYDSDACGTIPVDYSWLPFALVTNSPGPTGSTGGMLTITEQDALGTSNSASALFIDTSLITSQTDAVGDANVMVTKDVHWCGHADATNVNNVTGFVHAYAIFGSGVFIYNGMDTNDMSTGTTPGTADGPANLAKMWLQELQLSDTNTLVCSTPVAGPAKGPAPALDKVGLAIAFALLLLAGTRLVSRRQTVTYDIN